jgi:hypothetical protein
MSSRHPYLPQCSWPAGGGWLTPQQELLLRAALLSGETALQAWEQWQAQVDFDRLEPRAVRLLPLLYGNLHAHGIAHAWLGRCKGIYRRTWYTNQLLVPHLATALHHLQEAGISTLLFKGAALGPLHYRDPGLRVIDDANVLVPPDQAAAAFQVLRALHWTPDPLLPELPEAWQACSHRFTFRHAAGHAIALYWRTLAVRGATQADEAFWASRVPVEIGGVTTAAPHPTDHLLLVCTYGAGWNRVPSLHWIADAVTLLRTTPAFDWDRLVTRTSQHQQALLMQARLQYLRQSLAVPIPATVLYSLQALPVSQIEQRVFQLQTQRPDQRGVWWLVQYYYRRYAQAMADHGRPSTWLTFLRYMQQRHALAHLWQAPWLVLWHGAQNTRLGHRR